MLLYGINCACKTSHDSVYTDACLGLPSDYNRRILDMTTAFGFFTLSIRTKLFSPPSVPMTFFWSDSLRPSRADIVRSSSWFLATNSSMSALWSPLPVKPKFVSPLPPPPLPPAGGPRPRSPRSRSRRRLGEREDSGLLLRRLRLLRRRRLRLRLRRSRWRRRRPRERLRRRSLRRLLLRLLLLLSLSLSLLLLPSSEPEDELFLELEDFLLAEDSPPSE
mmetsp:Transcript_63213/g.110149  ORF Transcript_63213/g.110149 Transcript_63213/m.110149 type:complete len:220 (-) Transcript_63213:961-1620(-)